MFSDLHESFLEKSFGLVADASKYTASWLTWREGGFISINMSENTCGVVVDAIAAPIQCWIEKYGPSSVGFGTENATDYVKVHFSVLAVVMCTESGTGTPICRVFGTESGTDYWKGVRLFRH